MQDGVAFVIAFLGEIPVAEFEADSLEEKNKIFRMLTLIIQINKKNQSKDKGDSQAAPTLQPSANIIKEGRIEKKGHSVAYFNWAMCAVSAGARFSPVLQSLAPRAQGRAVVFQGGRPGERAQHYRAQQRQRPDLEEGN